ncbi:ABC transporter substrate-binding protein [Desulfospira joergensenii]|uniref:ABC transporter substrate-binding protein n=1 Tax=Desulfospira joergensenii TaxID=53329 RepID=UPI0003B40DF5|nr:extracellular solute-binding protein [Desulfospira joergensenii]
MNGFNTLYYEANIYITALAMGYSVNELATAENLNNPKFKKKLRELAQNSSVMWEGIDTADILQNNSIAAVWGFSLPELAKRGQVWKIAEPKEGTMGWVDNFAIGWSLKNKPFLRKVAEEWLNFVISPDFQVEVTVRSLGSAPTNTHIQDRLTLEEIAMFHINDPDYFQNNRILWPTLKRTRDRNFMKHLWEKALIKK